MMKADVPVFVLICLDVSWSAGAKISLSSTLISYVGLLPTHTPYVCLLLTHITLYLSLTTLIPYAGLSPTLIPYAGLLPTLIHYVGLSRTLIPYVGLLPTLGCLPIFWHWIPCLFPDFFLVFPNSPSTFYILFSGIYPLKIRNFRNVFKFWYFFFNFLVHLKRFLDFTKIPWLFPKFPDSSLTFQGLDFSLTSLAWQTPRTLIPYVGLLRTLIHHIGFLYLMLVTHLLLYLVLVSHLLLHLMLVSYLLLYLMRSPPHTLPRHCSSLFVIVRHWSSLFVFVRHSLQTILDEHWRGNFTIFQNWDRK